MATLAQAAEHLGVSVGTLKRMRGAGLLGDACVPRGRAGVDLERLRHALADGARRAAGGERAERPLLDPEQERARKDAAAADKLELELGVRRGDLVPAADAERAVAAVFVDAAARLDEIGPRLLARHPDARALVDEVEAEIHDVRTRIADGPE